MLGFGFVSRLALGWICDHIGGRLTLLLGSSLQALARSSSCPSTDSPRSTSCRRCSAFPGRDRARLRRHRPRVLSPEEAGLRVGIVLMATVFGMALGGWMSGVIFDLTGSYHAAFLNEIVWNVLNLAIAVGLLRRPGRPLEEGWP